MVLRLTEAAHRTSMPNARPDAPLVSRSRRLAHAAPALGRAATLVCETGTEVESRAFGTVSGSTTDDVPTVEERE
jgi:hypothetical protein